MEESSSVRAVLLNGEGLLTVYAAVGAAGVIGALLRYYLGLSIGSWWSAAFPLGTLLINLSGSFILSWFTFKTSGMKQIPDWFRISFGTGLIGSYTTFSTFSMETVHLIQNGLWGIAISYVLLSLWGGLAMSWLGYRTAA